MTGAGGCREVSGDHTRFIHGVGSVSGIMGDFNAPHDLRDAAAEGHRRMIWLATDVCGLLM